MTWFSCSGAVVVQGSSVLLVRWEVFLASKHLSELVWLGLAILTILSMLFFIIDKNGEPTKPNHTIPLVIYYKTKEIYSLSSEPEDPPR